MEEKQEHQDHYCTIKHVDEHEFSEIDFDFREEMFKVDLNNDDTDHDFHMLGQDYTRGHPLHIDRLIKYLQDVKAKGANYVSMEYHEDHIGYPIEALQITLSTPEEIQAHINTQIKREKNREKQVELLEQLRKLKEEE
jgi:hypothetical protein